MNFLLDIRRQGFKPADPVLVFVDADRPKPMIYSDMPLDFEICIRPHDNVFGMDFRGLVGLSVAVVAKEMNDRLRAVLSAIKRANPAFIGGGVPSENLMFAWYPSRGWEFDHVDE
jgi:hypothetical protein